MDWCQELEQKFFEQHCKVGNRWMQIAQILGINNHNFVKNKFYSTLRKGFRKINRFIALAKFQAPKSQHNFFKQLNPDFLTKLSAVADRNYMQKYQVKQQAIQLSKDIEHQLIELGRKDIDQQDIEAIVTEENRNLHMKILQFNKNCRRRKGKWKKLQDKKNNTEKQSDSQANAQEKSKSQQVQFKNNCKSQDKIDQKIKNNQQKDSKFVKQQAKIDDKMREKKQLRKVSFAKNQEYSYPKQYQNSIFQLSPEPSQNGACFQSFGQMSNRSPNMFLPSPYYSNYGYNFGFREQFAIFPGNFTRSQMSVTPRQSVIRVSDQVVQTKGVQNLFLSSEMGFASPDFKLQSQKPKSAGTSTSGFENFKTRFQRFRQQMPHLEEKKEQMSELQNQ